MKKFSAWLRDLYIRKMFFPGILGIFMNPFYFSRKGLARHIKSLGTQITGKTLDIGCGHKPYETLYNASEYIGLEYDSPANREHKKAEHFYDGTTFPFESASFDSAVANEVLEHVFNPDQFLDETCRILKPGGTLLLTVPFVWDEHEQPHDFARYSSFGLFFLLEKHGFEILDHRKSVDDIRVIFQLLNAYLFKKTETRSFFVNLLSSFFLMTPFNIMGEIAAWLTPRNPDLYLDNIVLARKVQKRD